MNLSPDVLQIGLALIGGGVIQAILNFLVNRRKEGRLDMVKITTMLKEDNERLREEEERCKKRVNHLEDTVLQYKKELNTWKRRVQDLENRLKILEKYGEGK